MQSIDRIIANAKAAELKLAQSRAQTKANVADRAIDRAVAAQAAMETKSASQFLKQSTAPQQKTTITSENKTTNAQASTPSTITTPAVAVVSSSAVKTAPIDTVLFNDESVPIEVMTDLIFENIGGQELINIARNDIINGQQVSYQPIRNLSSIQQQYNHNNILGIQNTSDKYFSNFSIKFENKIPNTGSGPNGSNVYLDSTTGNMIIETVNMESDEQIEVEITVSGIIYEAEFGEII